MALLDDVTAAAARAREAEAELHERRDELHAQLRRAYAERIPVAVIARAAGLSRERVRQLVKRDE